jgi:hypothetical protein
LSWLKSIFIFACGGAAGVLLGFWAWHRPTIAPESPTICYSCFWEGYDAKLHSDVIDFYRQYKNPDPIVLADTRYVLWRASSIPNCDIRRDYRDAARATEDPQRKYVAYSVLAFGARECGLDGQDDFQNASKAAANAGLPSEAAALSKMAEGNFQPKFERTKIESVLTAPAGTKSFILGASKLVITPQMRIGAQVDRVARDWISYQLKWDLTDKPLSTPLLDYHEGAVVKKIREASGAAVYPLTGAIVAREGKKWYGMDDTGTFRFNILDDKMMYPTSHATRDVGWIEDTHGISALVPQALERKVDVVVGCGDAEGKAEASFYLAQKGVNVLFPGDRFEDLLLGYIGKGVLMGGAPVRAENGNAVIGDQPIRFDVNEPIIVEDTVKNFPLQYYDSPARFFRRFNQALPLKLNYVLVDDADQISRVLDTARAQHAHAVGVRVVTELEYNTLKAWLHESPQNRAVLFHSALYKYAQPLFAEFRTQVTFGDLHPKFE